MTKNNQYKMTPKRPLEGVDPKFLQNMTVCACARVYVRAQTRAHYLTIDPLSMDRNSLLFQVSPGLVPFSPICGHLTDDHCLSSHAGHFETPSATCMKPTHVYWSRARVQRLERWRRRRVGKKCRPDGSKRSSGLLLHS